LTSRKLKEVDDAYRDAATLLKDKPVDFSSIIIDETQDFGPQALRLLRAMVASGANDLFFVGDGHQRIYNRNRASMTACGIDIRGRSRKLYLNYRTTEEIRRAAVAMLEGCEVDDLDEGSDEVKRYKSVSHGPRPAMLKMAHLEEAYQRLITIAGESIAQGRTACVMVPTKREAEAVAVALKEAKVPATIIGPDERDQPDSTSVRVATMHRAKGLEFDEVVLLVSTQTGQQPGATSDQRRLQYVAITRAKKLATVIRVG
jgi:superfamily I DNA/RNA helicase